jgi:UDP-N-acetyl-D-mannosaminuronate dehydrogenase
MNKSKLICVQGLGFVGAAMLAAASLSKSDENREIKLIGVDLDTEEGNKRIESINNGVFPFKTSGAS